MFIWIGEHGQRLERAGREGEQRLDDARRRRAASPRAPRHDRDRDGDAEGAERRAGDVRQEREIAGPEAAAGDGAERDRCRARRGSREAAPRPTPASSSAARREQAAEHPAAGQPQPLQHAATRAMPAANRIARSRGPATAARRESGGEPPDGRRRARRAESSRSGSAGGCSARSRPSSCRPSGPPPPP